MVIGQKHRVETDRNERNILFYFFFRFDFSTFNNEQPFIRENAMKIRRMLRPIVCMCVSRKMLRVKSSKGWKKMHEKGRVLPHIRGAVRCLPYGPSFFLPTSVRLSSHMTKVTTHVCVHVCVYSCTWVPCWLPWKWTIFFFFFFVTTYNNKNEQPSFASGGNFSLSLGIYKYK